VSALSIKAPIQPFLPLVNLETIDPLLSIISKNALEQASQKH